MTTEKLEKNIFQLRHIEYLKILYDAFCRLLPCMGKTGVMESGIRNRRA